MPEPVVIYLYAPSYEKVYDGSPLVPSVEDVGFESLSEGYSFSVTLSGSQTNVGESACTISSYTIRDSAGNDVTSSCTVNLEPGTLTVTPVVISISSPSDTKIYNGYPYPECTDNLSSMPDLCYAWAKGTGSSADAGTYSNDIGYELHVSADQASNYSVQLNPGTITIYTRSITVTSSDDSKEYDGTPLTCEEFIITGDGMTDADMINCNFTGSQTDVGSSSNSFTVSGQGDTNLNNYSISTVFGTLTVTEAKPYVTITVPDRSKTYDGQPFAEQTVEASEAPGVYYTYPASNDPNAGSTSGYSYTVSGNTDAYHITWANSTVTYTISQYPIVFNLSGANLDVEGHWMLGPASMNGIYGSAALTTDVYTIPNVTPTETVTLTTSSSIANSNGQIVDLTPGQTYDINYSYTFSRTNSSSDPNYSVTVTNTQYVITGTLPSPVSLVFNLNGGELPDNGHWAVAPPSLNDAPGTTADGDNTWYLSDSEHYVTLNVTSNLFTAGELHAGDVFDIIHSISFSSNVDTSNYNVSYENTKYIIVASPSGPVVTDDSYDPGIFDDPGYTGIDTGD